jgi:hypothetical protein
MQQPPPPPPAPSGVSSGSPVWNRRYYNGPFLETQRYTPDDAPRTGTESDGTAAASHTDCSEPLAREVSGTDEAWSDQAMSICRHMLSEISDDPVWLALAWSDKMKEALKLEWAISPMRGAFGNDSEKANFLIQLAFQKNLFQEERLFKSPDGFIVGTATMDGCNCLIHSALQLLREEPVTEHNKLAHERECRRIRAKEKSWLPHDYLDARRLIKIQEHVCGGAPATWVLHSGLNGDITQHVGPATPEALMAAHHLYNPGGRHFEPLWPQLGSGGAHGHSAEKRPAVVDLEADLPAKRKQVKLRHSGCVFSTSIGVAHESTLKTLWTQTIDNNRHFKNELEELKSKAEPSSTPSKEILFNAKPGEGWRAALKQHCDGPAPEWL